jgi:hypothetical protein
MIEVRGDLDRPECFHECEDAFDVITVPQGSKNTVNYVQVPVLQPHWSKLPCSTLT